MEEAEVEVEAQAGEERHLYLRIVDEITSQPLDNIEKRKVRMGDMDMEWCLTMKVRGNGVAVREESEKEMTDERKKGIEIGVGVGRGTMGIPTRIVIGLETGTGTGIDTGMIVTDGDMRGTEKEIGDGKTILHLYMAWMSYATDFNLMYSAARCPNPFTLTST